MVVVDNGMAGGDGGVVQLQIRIRIPSATSDAAIEYSKKFLKNCAQICTVDEDSLAVLPSITSHYEDAVTEVEATIIANPNYSYCPLFAQDFLHKLQRAGKHLQDEPLLQITQPPEAFVQECISAHMKRPLLAFELGNFINPGTFYVHYEKELAQCDPLLLTQLRREPLTNGLIVDVEHDRSVLTVRFATNKYVQKSRSLVPYAVALVVEYSWIRRIVVDPKCIDTKGNKAMRIYLHLSGVPETHRFFDNGATFVSNGSRYNCWHDKTNHNRHTESSSLAALKDCSIISLVFPAHQAGGIYEIIGRLKARTQLPIFFGSIFHVRTAISNYITEPEFDPECQDWLRQSSFDIKYAIAAFMSRGAVVKDQLLLRKNDRDNFVRLVCACSMESELLTLEALERLLNCVDERRNVTLTEAFQSIFEHLRPEKERLLAMRERDRKDGYIRVRKVIVTPTRRLLISPERMMGNRVLTKFDPDGQYAIRIQFRDDSGSALRSYGSDRLIDNTINAVMINGLCIAGRKFTYLGSSNSQLHDHGCYFFADYDNVTVHSIRHWMGDFDKENIPKRMARMGQCLTQARKLIDINLSHYTIVDDVERRIDNKKYIFSDGVGRISLELAKEIAKRHGLHYVPSCFQFRFRGLKGVLSVDPTLDARIKKAIEKGRRAEPHIIFRKSQEKFQTPRAHGNGCAETLEIVKFSAPTSVCLNRPMIAILDQISEKQSDAAHKRVKERIHYLLENDLNELASMLTDEEKCAKTLEDELPFRFDVHRVQKSGFLLTTESYFRRLTRAIARYRLKRQLIKDQIQVPPELGRTLFGVMDETGELKYGQVFIQVTANVNAIPRENTRKEIITGRVMVTKNPCTVLGDIRLLEAVDIPKLRHLNDVIVFPSCGPRPHPDEMAGSDLDGDEYAAMWDKDLMFDDNEPASTNSPLVSMSKQIPDENDLDREMAAFFLKFIKSDSIGTFSIAHLVNADRYGIESDVCKSIAEKCFQAVDFAKTGEMPADLTTQSNTKCDLLPEKADHYPDFMGSSRFKPSYFSPRLLGEIYRRIKAVDNVYSLTENEVQAHVEVDKDLEIDGWQHPRYLFKARLLRNKYSAEIRALLEEYGVADEGQLMSGSITSVRSRISDREHEDYSAYTTDRLIKQRVTQIVDSFREEFFEEFGGVEQCTRPINEWDERRRQCFDPTPEMLLKASSWYMVTYEERASDVLGFPWVVWDLLACIKESKIHANSSRDPIAEHLSTVIDDMGTDDLASDQLQVLNNLLARFHGNYVGLDKLFLALLRWGTAEKAFIENFRWEHLCNLFIQFGLGQLKWEFRSRNSFLADPFQQLAAVDLSTANRGGLGRYLIDFVQYLASRDYSNMPSANCLHLHLHRMAIKAFYHVALTGTFDALGVSTSAMSGKLAIVEEQPFMIELPPATEQWTDDQVMECIRRKTGVLQVSLRRHRPSLVMVSARGTFESLHSLRDLVIVEHVNLQYLLERIVS